MNSTLLLRLRTFLAALACLASGIAAAQADFRPFGKEQIDQLTAQVALFPDALLSQVLMAATYPKDVAEAAAWARANPDEKGDAAVALVEDKPWDPSVQSLVAFPQVVVMMGENPTWVKDLGDAFLLQPEDVMDSVQRLRLAAQTAGNLQSNEQVVVKVETQPPPEIVVQVNAPPPPPQVIVIEQRSPEVIFVPMYNPVNVFGPWMWPAFPPVWIPPPPGFWWSWRSPVAAGIWWGVGIGVTHAVWGRANWWGRSVNINVHHHNSIHIHNRIDRRDRNVTWAHDTNRRRDVPFRGGDATRQRLDDRAARVDRDQFRGREADRARAEQALRDRGVTTDRSALRDVNRDDLRRPVQDAGGAATRDRLQGADRDAARERAQQVDRAAALDRAQGAGTARDRAGQADRGAAADRAQAAAAARDRAQQVDRAAAADRAREVDRTAARDRVQQADRSAVPDRSRDTQRVPALQGAGDRNARQEIDRGNASRESAQRQLPSRPQQQPAQRPAQPQRAANTGASRPQPQQARDAAANRSQQRPLGGARPSR